MADEIEKKLGVKPILTRGDKGIFDVKVDGQTVYSKYEEGRFPDEGELSIILDERTH